MYTTHNDDVYTAFKLGNVLVKGALLNAESKITFLLRGFNAAISSLQTSQLVDVVNRCRCSLQSDATTRENKIRFYAVSLFNTDLLRRDEDKSEPSYWTAWTSDVTLECSWITPDTCLWVYVRIGINVPLNSLSFHMGIRSQIIRTSRAYSKHAMCMYIQT